MRWLRERECPWDEYTCEWAAKGGHLEVLRWAREHHCPWDARTAIQAANWGHAEVLKWAKDNGCPGSALLEVLADIPAHEIGSGFRYDTDTEYDTDSE